MSDRILLNGLEVFAFIGVSEEERKRRQKLKISLEMKVSGVAEAALSDDLSLTVDYFAVSGRIKEIVDEKPRQLIETLAEEIAAMVLREFVVKEVSVKVEKFILSDAEAVAVQIKRKRPKKHKVE